LGSPQTLAGWNLGNPVGSLGGYDDAAAKAEVGPDRGDAHLAMEGIALTG